MTVLELMHQYAARENELMRRNMDMVPGSKPGPRGPFYRQRTEPLMQEIHGEQIIAFLTDNPGSGLHEILSALHLNKEQWKRARLPLLRSGAMVRKADAGKPGTYWVAE
jgi:hypothetical protein